MTDTDSMEQRPSIVRVQHPDLSLWQSAVREVVAQRHLDGDVRSPLLHANPAVEAADGAAYDMYMSPDAAARAGLALDRHPWVSKLLELSQRVLGRGVLAELAELRTASRAFSNLDPEFVVECMFAHSPSQRLVRGPNATAFPPEGEGWGGGDEQQSSGGRKGRSAVPAEDRRRRAG